MSEVVVRFTREERTEIKSRLETFDRDVARVFVDAYYQAQGERKRVGNQKGAIERRVDSGNAERLEWFKADRALVEAKVKFHLGVIARSHEAGRWAISIPGIADVFTAGLLALVDVRVANTAGKLWSFFGVNPEQREWKKGTKRPYCAIGKTITWQIGESFKKVMNCGDCICTPAKPQQHVGRCYIYSKVYRERKVLEVERNEAGLFREQALARLEKLKNKRISDEQREIWASGKLQNVGLDIRAGRVAAKLFLSHFHHVLHEVELGSPPPVPWVLQHGGHVDYIPVPNWPMDD